MNRAALFFLTFYLYSLFLFISGLVTPILTGAVAALAAITPRRRNMKRFRRSISWYGKIITAAAYPFIKVRYEDHAGKGSEGPFIFVCNHQSASDPFLMSALPHECVQTVNIWPFRIPVLGLYARLAGYLNIRMMAHEQFIEKASILLKQGVSIIFFPEGTRSTTGRMGSFHGAAFRLALASKAPVVPLCIFGNENIPPKGSLMLRPGTIKVRRLPAITWDEYKDLTAFAFKNRVWHIIDDQLKEMERGETAGKPQTTL